VAGIVTGASSEQGRRLLDEALRLLDVAQASRPEGGSQEPGRHAGAECRICPLCRGIAYLREVDPQAVERLTGAVTDLAGAVRDLLGAVPATTPASAPPTAGPGEGGEDDPAAADPAGPGPTPVAPRVSVQQIDVTD
jgi:hypothetical protein